MSTHENGTPETPEWDLRESLARGLREAAAGLARPRPEFLADVPAIPPNITLGTE